MPTVFNNAEVAHVWSSQRQESGRNSNQTIFFHGDTIYSYGDHFPMARIVSLSERRILVTTRSYSVTTSSHLSDVWSAVRGSSTCSVDDVMASNASEHKANLRCMVANLNDLTGQHSRSRKYKEMIMEQIRKVARSVVKYRLWFKCGRASKVVAAICVWVTSQADESPQTDAQLFKILDVEFKAVNEAHQKAEAARKKKEAAVAAERAEKAKGRLAEWVEGKTVFNHNFTDLPVALRVDPADENRIQTSHGATVARKAAMVLYKALIKKAELPKAIDGYSPIMANSHCLRIGCHRIPLDELKRLYEALMQQPEPAVA